MSPTARLAANAKINWGLELLGKREDGYHEILTVTHTVTLCDEVEVELTNGEVGVQVSGEWLAPEGPRNICWRAVERFCAALAPEVGARVRLNKRVPPGSGLGGGSVDCVATLVALATLTGRGTQVDLERLAAGLGSDTVLFLRGGAAICSGRGEVVEPLPVPRTYWMVLARPGISVSTADAYGLISPRNLSDGSEVRELARLLAEGAEPERLGAVLVNAFRHPVGEKYPEIDEVVADLADAGALAAQMTGSGSASFGLVADEAQARAVEAAMRAAGHWSVAVQTTSCGVQVLEVTDT
jgi:4-diphosphocytidyl-2-C-methyl-D-erythritol kinase